MPLSIIFNVKVDLRKKARLVIRFHVVDSYVHDVYDSIMKSVSDRILMIIVAANDLEVMTGDIKKLYINANTKERIYTRAGSKFELVGIMGDETLLEVVKELYILYPRGNKWHAHLSHTLRVILFKPTRFEPDIWFSGREGGYDCIGKHTNEVLVVAFTPLLSLTS